MAEKIGKITEEFDKNKAEQWIKFFLQEFIKKFSLIDFLRMDKYIMLTEVILKNFLIHSNKEGNLDSILQFIQFFSSNLHCGNYNFCFVSIVIKIISTFIQEMSKEFIFLHFSALLDRLLEVRKFDLMI